METCLICCLILLTSFVEGHSETKEVFRGETVLLFANVTADSTDNEIYLYINGVKDNALIARWKYEKAGFTTVSKTYHNIVMDVDRNIWIHNVDETYTGTYSLYNSSRLPIELKVLGNSQNIVRWIVIVVLAVALVFVVILYVACKTYREYRKKKRASAKDQFEITPSSEEDDLLVKETPREDKKHVIESLEALEKVNETLRDDLNRVIERLESLEKVNETLRDDQKRVIETLEALEKVNEPPRDDQKRVIERLESLEKELQEVNRRCTRQLVFEAKKMKKSKTKKENDCKWKINKRPAWEDQGYEKDKMRNMTNNTKNVLESSMSKRNNWNTELDNWNPEGTDIKPKMYNCDRELDNSLPEAIFISDRMNNWNTELDWNPKKTFSITEMSICVTELDNSSPEATVIPTEMSTSRPDKIYTNNLDST